MTNKEQITDMATRLRSLQAREERIGSTLLRWIEDPLKPKSDKGNLRINPIVVLLAMMALLAGSTFLFFSFVQL